ncbi:hypothetical protein [Pseudomonas fildesensis]|uniref:hypothetical protein n=1 Tax=Pseudomonas fildesensis TaxID=1674920 RepID=UPI00128C09C0|nr:hypothetical protein [Pseudomonas fildesensis]
MMKVTLRVVSNLSFTATLSKHKPLVFLEKAGGLWFLASEKRSNGTDAEYFSLRIRGKEGKEGKGRAKGTDLFKAPGKRYLHKTAGFERSQRFVISVG